MPMPENAPMGPHCNDSNPIWQKTPEWGPFFLRAQLQLRQADQESPGQRFKQPAMEAQNRAFLPYFSCNEAPFWHFAPGGPEIAALYAGAPCCTSFRAARKLRLKAKRLLFQVLHEWRKRIPKARAIAHAASSSKSAEET